MKSSEIEKELGMSYLELVDYLLAKYGPAKVDYFRNEKCRSKCKEISRTGEGLQCHHIDEDKAIMLSNPRYAILNPFEYQKADRLVYCNVLEHLILHIKIVEGPRHLFANSFDLPGVGGAVNFLCPQINDYYNGYEFKQQYLINLYSVIKDNFEDYIRVLEYFLDIAKFDNYDKIVNKKSLSLGTNGKIVDKIFARL